VPLTVWDAAYIGRNSAMNAARGMRRRMRASRVQGS
jgi:hypothetical protein